MNVLSDDSIQNEQITAQTSGNTAYSNYLSCIETGDSDESIEIIPVGSNTVTQGNAGFVDSPSGNKNSGLAFSEEESTAEITFYTESSISGYLQFTYIPVRKGCTTSSSIGIMVNGSYPFDESKELELIWRWRQGKNETDKRGNQILPSMEAIYETTSCRLADPSGRRNDPLIYSFEAGENKLTVVAHTGNFILCSIRICGIEKKQTYAEVLESYKNNGYSACADADTILEAENYKEASASTLTADYDKNNSATSPNSPYLLYYNIISGDKYTESGQWLLWEFTPEQSGLYNISMRARQDNKSGFSVNRRLLIDDQVPFGECDEISFSYSDDWHMKTLGDDAPYQFYFEAGKTYQIKLMVTPGSLSEITVGIDDLIYDLNSLYRSVIMVAGTDPDTYRDYQLNKVIPGFDAKIADIKNNLEKSLDLLEARNKGKSGSSLTAFHTLINRLEKIQKDPDLLARTSPAFKGDIQSLSSWNQDAKELPLDLDYIMIHSPDVQIPGANAGFFKELSFKLKRVVASFSEDYGVVGEVYDEENSLNLWISTGRDQMNVIKRLIDNSFWAQTGINVNVSLVTVDIRSAVLSRTAPDVSLFLSGDMAVNLAIRSSVEDLSRYDGFNEVKKRFEDSSMTPFAYKEGCYALPVTETYNMMFVRTDILDELELEIPQTWEDFYQVATVLQRNNLEVGIPSNIGMFATLLFQYGGEFYNDGLTRTAFDSDSAITAFKMWTGLFSRYGFPLTYDFYNRFSSGEMPVAIIDYTQYLKINAASPELSGRWKMVPVPGVKQTDGTIDRTLCISTATGSDTSPGLAQSVSCGVIYSQSEKKSEAWELLKWFTSDEVQTDYGRDIEAALGSIARYTPANRAAFNNLSWSKEERSLLAEQRASVKTLNEISGNYSVTRELINAFRHVVYDNANPTDTIYTYNKRINKELSRKQEENKR